MRWEVRVGLLAFLITRGDGGCYCRHYNCHKILKKSRKRGFSATYTGGEERRRVGLGGGGWWCHKWESTVSPVNYPY